MDNLSPTVYDDAKFRQLFPEFSDTTKYPAVTLSLWWDMTGSFIDCAPPSWAALNGDRLAWARYLLLAHIYSLSLANVAEIESEGGTEGGAQGGFVNSARIGEVSVSKVAPPSSDMFEWWIGQTPYGQQLWAMMQVLAVGGFSVGGLPEREGFRKIGGVFF